MVVEYTYSPWGEILSTTGDEANTIGVINPFRYRGYYYDEETGLYYLNARYYDPETGRFISADSYVSTGQSFIGHNMFAYCVNNPVNYYDSDGNVAVGVATFVGWTAGAGASNFWNPIGWVLIGVAVVTTTAIIGYEIYINFQSQDADLSSFNTKVLPDVSLKRQLGKPYSLAYISDYAGLIKLGKKMSFVEALSALGITGAANNFSKIYQYDRGKSSDAQRALEHRGTGNWGIYADSQSAAKALAYVLGGTNPPEVHSSGMYGHYHDSTHTFHIWYGGVISY